MTPPGSASASLSSRSGDTKSPAEAREARLADAFRAWNWCKKPDRACPVRRVHRHRAKAPERLLAIREDYSSRSRIFIPSSRNRSTCQGGSNWELPSHG